MRELNVIKVSGGYSGEVDYFILAGEGFAAGTGMAAEPGVFIIEAIKRSNIPAVGLKIRLRKSPVFPATGMPGYPRWTTCTAL